ncbi:hypothetical protein Tco_0739591 [Tanacetum coccineum]
MSYSSVIIIIPFSRDTSLDVGVDKVFDELSVNKFLKRRCTVKEYYDAFTSSFSNQDLDEGYLIDLFVFGLQPEIEERVKWFKPRSFLDAYALATVQETTYNLLKKMDAERDKLELFGNCSRGFVKVDEIDREKFVENGFKLDKIDDSIVDSDKVCEEEEDEKGHESESSGGFDNNIDLKNHGEEVKGNKEVMNLVDFGCGKSGTNLICSCMSGNSHCEAKRIKHIMVNSSDTDRNINFNKVEISREEYEDTDIIIRDLMSGKIERSSWELDHIDRPHNTPHSDYALVYLGTRTVGNEFITPKSCRSVGCIKNGGIRKWPKMKKASHVNFKFKSRPWKFDTWTWKREKTGPCAKPVRNGVKLVEYGLNKWRSGILEEIVFEEIELFIDAKDEVGTRAGSVGGNDETEQTLHHLCSNVDRIDIDGRSCIENYTVGVYNMVKELFMVSFEAVVDSFQPVLNKVKVIQMFVLPNNKLNPQVHLTHTQHKLNKVKEEFWNRRFHWTDVGGHMDQIETIMWVFSSVWVRASFTSYNLKMAGTSDKREVYDVILCLILEVKDLFKGKEMYGLSGDTGVNVLAAINSPDGVWDLTLLRPGRYKGPSLLESIYGVWDYSVAVSNHLELKIHVLDVQIPILIGS